MNAPQKFAGFVLGLAAVFAVAVGVGATLGPDGGPAPAEHLSETHDAGAAASVSPTPNDLPGGMMSTDHGYTLELAAARTDAGVGVPLRFRILDAHGTPVTRYAESHDKQLHLIVVRRDLAGFQHVHPALDETGTWTVPVDLSRAGDYRVFADFTPEGGDALTLGADLHVAGTYDPQPLSAAAATATVDGYTVTLSGDPRAGAASMLTLAVSRDGTPVTDLQPYLGAYGHLVALRAADLAYLHVHPMGAPGDGTTPAGPEIGFHATVPSAGEYRLFLDFQHRGVVRTAEFTVSVGAAQQAAPAPAPEPAAAGHGH